MVTRQLPTSSGGGRIVVSAQVGGLKYLFRRSAAWDPELLRITSLLIKQGDQVWDIGANVGLFAMAARHHAGEAGSVLAVEADQDAVSLLFRTGRACEGLTILPIAISDEDGFVRFSIARRARAANAIEGFGSTQTGGVLEVRILPSWRLDSLARHYRIPDVLKIFDVEGAELGVLSGARNLPATARPRIYCEVTTATRADVVSLLQSYGYSLFDGESFGTSLPRPVDGSTTNLVALPSQAPKRAGYA